MQEEVKNSTAVKIRAKGKIEATAFLYARGLKEESYKLVTVSLEPGIHGNLI